MPAAPTAFTPTRPGSRTSISTVRFTHPPASGSEKRSAPNSARLKSSPAAIPSGLQVALDAGAFVAVERAAVHERLPHAAVHRAAVGVEAAPHDVAEPYHVGR